MRHPAQARRRGRRGGLGLTPRPLTWDDVDARRLATNHLTVPAPVSDLCGVVSRACGIQAQVLSAAELALSARIPDLRTADVQAALWEHRSLVKTYGPRGTIHLLAADDLPLYMASLRDHPYWRADAILATLGLEALNGTTLVEAFADALDGRRLTRDELAAAVAQRVGPSVEEPLRSNWGSLLRPAAFAGVLCFAPSVGSRVTFVRADQWVDGWPSAPIDPAVANTEIVRRFLAAYGPASEAEMAAWLGTGPAEVRLLVGGLRPDVEEVEIDGDGRSRWQLAGVGHGAEPAPPPAPRPTLRLLPQYDSYVLGHRQRARLVPPAARARIARDPKGRLEHVVGVSVLLVDGAVGGLWWRKAKARSLTVTVEPTVALEASHLRLLDAEVARVAAFVGARETTLVWSG